MYEFNNLSSAITLSNGVGLPCVGYGTWRSPDSELTSECVTAALKAGYRHIDGAAVYRNETRVGQGIRDSGVAREKRYCGDPGRLSHAAGPAIPSVREWPSDTAIAKNTTDPTKSE